MLATYEQIKELAFFEGSDKKKVKKVTLLIPKSEQYLKDSILCAEIYNELVTQVSSGYIATLYQGLFDSVLEYIAWQTYIYYSAFAQIHDTDAGFRAFNDQNSTESPSKMVAQQVKQAETFVLLAEENIKKYLENNKSEFPADCFKVCNDDLGFTFKITGA
jgi:hypothetical protein